MTESVPQSTGPVSAGKRAELLLERVILSSRWMLVGICLVLAAALALYAVTFFLKFIKVATKVWSMDENETILAMLTLIDGALVAGLMVMVMISTYENYVSRFDDENTDLAWLGKVDSGSLKIKVASAIVAISSIHLLQIFLNVGRYQDNQVMWALLLHLTFIISALLLGILDRIVAGGKTKKAH